MHTDKTNISDPIQIGSLSFSPQLKQIQHANGEIVALEDKISDLLTYFHEHADTVVSREDILDNVWGSRNLSEQTVPVAISKLRKAIGDTQADNRLIQTVPKRGYRLVMPKSATVLETQTDKHSKLPRSLVGGFAILALITFALLWPSSTPLAPPVDAGKPGIILTVKDIRTSLESQKDNGKVIALSELASFYLSQIPEVLVIRHWWNVDAPDPTGGIFTRYGENTPVYLLKGSLIEDEGNLLVTLFLSNPKTDEVIWSGVHPVENGSEAYFNTLSDMFATIGVLGTPQSRGALARAPSEDDRYWAARYLMHLSSQGAAKRAAQITNMMLADDPKNEVAADLVNALSARWTDADIQTAEQPKTSLRSDYMTYVDDAVIAFYKMKDIKKANELIDQALALAPGDHYAVSLKAEILAASGSMDSALLTYQKASRLAPFAAYEERIASIAPEKP